MAKQPNPKRGKKYIGGGRDNPSSSKYFTPGKGAPHTGDGYRGNPVFKPGSGILASGFLKLIFRDANGKKLK